MKVDCVVCFTLRILFSCYAIRLKQLDDLQEAANKYHGILNDTTHWLTDTERQLEQSQLAHRDPAAIRAKIRELMVSLVVMVMVAMLDEFQSSTLYFRI